MNKPFSIILFVQNHTQYHIDSAFAFTGKEKDYETGYHYFGARYYDSEALTGWLSVDPMMDKYPSMSPYNYCVWNPAKLVDPDGRDGRIIVGERDGQKTITIQTTIYIKGGDNWKATSNEIKIIADDMNFEAVNYRKEKIIDDCIISFDIKFEVWSENITLQDGDNTMTLKNGSGSSEAPGQIVTDGFGFFITRLCGNNADINSQDIYTSGANRHVNVHAGMHEVFHLLGLKDRYSGTNTSDAGYERNIMGGNASYCRNLSNEQYLAYIYKYQANENGTYIQKDTIE